MPDIDRQPVLDGPELQLRPLRAQDREALYAAARDPLIWEQHPDPLRWQRAVFDARYFDPALASGGALVVIERASGAVIGSSRYYDWDPATREIAIGYTFLARSHWGGPANREMKQLMLSHIFGWAGRVWFHVGRDNRRSRRAMEKIGGRYSHAVRRHVDGVEVPYAYYVIERPEG